MATRLTRNALRRAAAVHTLFAPRALQDAIDRLGFVQIDPLRAPARAQDLILRPRVAGYRAGDLGRAYAAAPLIEDFLHVQGVLPVTARRLLHPRVLERTWHVESEHPRLAARLLAFIAREGAAHPRDLERAFGRQGVVNGWGGQSLATTRMLEVLHYRGHLHVVRRDEGIKVYGLAPRRPGRPLAPRTRMLAVLGLLLRLYAPLPVATLRELLRMASDAAFDAPARERLLAAFLARGDVASATIDGLAYVWPADLVFHPTASVDGVRLLAPFDPLVWDRRRFEHLHGWAYRFEAYTPAARRRFGYYALPLAWRERVVGWANVRRTATGLEVATGFAERRPAGRAFDRALDQEIARFAEFLAPPSPPVVAS